MTRRTSALGAALALALELTGCGAGDAAPKASAPQESAPESGPAQDNAHLPAGEASRGAALAKRNSCTLCHGGDYAGSGFNPNITPAPEGLGPWSDAEVVSAFRDGVDRQGTRLCSLMARFPFSDQEAADLLAYLRQLPPIASASAQACPGHGS